MNIGLEELLNPISKRDFLSKYWQAESLICQEGDADRFLTLMSIERIEEIFSSRELSRAQLRVVKNDRHINPKLYIDGNQPWSHVSREMALRYYSEGATLVFNGMQRHFTELSRFCGTIAEELTSRVHANVYLTPPGRQGFLAHYDTHDVFVLQLSGTKDWTLYESDSKLPLECHEYSTEEHFTGNIQKEFTLSAGQYCYVPRGVVHEAKATDDTSLHITIGVVSPLWIDVFKEAIDEFALSNVTLRKVLPDAYGSPKNSEIMDLVDEFVSSGCIERSYERTLERLKSRNNSRFSGRLLNVSRSSSVSSKSEVERIKPIVYKEKESEILLEIGGSILRLPLKTRESLSQLAKVERIAVKELSGDLDAEGNLVLVKRLIREELLKLV